MAISYPNSSNAGGGTTSRPQYAIPAAPRATFPIIISGSTTQQTASTIFFPPEFLYKTSGEHFLVLVGSITASSQAVCNFRITAPPHFSHTASLETPEGLYAIKFGSNNNFAPFDFAQMSETGFELDLLYSGSVSDYTASVYGLYFSPIT